MSNNENVDSINGKFWIFNPDNHIGSASWNSNIIAIKFLCDLYMHVLTNGFFYEKISQGKSSVNDYMRECALAVIGFPSLYRCHCYGSLARESRWILERTVNIARHRTEIRNGRIPDIKKISKGGIHKKYSFFHESNYESECKSEICKLYSRLSNHFHNLYVGEYEFFNNNPDSNSNVCYDLVCDSICYSLHVLLCNLNDAGYNQAIKVLKSSYPSYIYIHKTMRHY